MVLVVPLPSVTSPLDPRLVVLYVAVISKFALYGKTLTFSVSIIPIFFSSSQSPLLPVMSSDAAMSALVISDIFLIKISPCSVDATLQP